MPLRSRRFRETPGNEYPVGLQRITRETRREESGNAAARLIGAVTEHPSVGHAPCQGSLVEIAAVDASPVYRYSLMPVRELNDRQRPVRMTTQPRVRTVVIGLMTTTASAFPTLAHG